MIYRTVIACVTILFVVGLAQAQVVLNFEDGSLNDWEVVEDVDLGDTGPASWEIRDSQLGLDGKVLYQGSNIWGNSGDNCLMGTFIIFKGQKFTDFTIEMDIAAADNDGMGFVWAYEGTDRHYRAIMINDVWPAPANDGYDGPFMKIAKRISDEDPWYELLEVVKDDYVPYAEGAKLHWTLEVNNGNFTFTREDGLSISASDSSYVSGYIGIQLYAQQAEFDNLTITPVGGAAVKPEHKAATVWGKVKSSL